MRIQGSCHCGNIRFELTWERAPSTIPARACGCGFCTKHGGVWSSDPAASLAVSVREPALVSKYEFGTATAEFHLCGRCGIVPVVTSTIDDHVYAVVSVNAFDNVPEALLDRRPVDFNGEDVASRLARRQRGWIANVRFDTGR
jgi:hypothetical protein